MKSCSVLTVTRRTGWEEMAQRSIESQTVQPDKWIIVTEQPITINRVPANVVAAPTKKKVSNLNASLNAGLRLINTDYVIFYQDFIELPKDCFEKLLNLANAKTFVTTCTPNVDGSDDTRYTGCDCPRPCIAPEWEANVAVAPMGVIKELGGFDERLDDGWSWDNVLLATKAHLLGCKFICDESNRPKLYPHDMTTHNTLPENRDLCVRIVRDIIAGREPLRLNNL